MIENVIFDMGNVLINFDPVYIASHYTSDPAVLQLLLDNIFYAPEWPMTDAGTVSDEEFLRRIDRRFPAECRQVGRDAFLNFHRQIRGIPEADALVRDLKQAGYGTYLLSNASTRWNDYWREYPAIAMLDGHIVSALVGAVKPDPKIYRILFDTYDLKPEECFFVDDLSVNIAGARAVGMDGYVFDHFQYDDLRDTLKARGVKLP